MKIYLSYCHKNIKTADTIDEDFKVIGLLLIRDIRDVHFKDSFEKFMKKAGYSDYVLLIISKEFLESRNCMNEVIEVLKNKDYAKRIIPIVLPNAQIHDENKRLEYIEFWENKHKCLNKKIQNKTLENRNKEIITLKIISEIINSFDNFIYFIHDRKYSPLEDLRKNNYRDILNYINYDQNVLIDELFSITNYSFAIELLLFSASSRIF